MNTKTLIAAAALASMPMMASAAVIPISDGGTTIISASNGDLFTFDVDPAAGGFSHTFTLTNNGSGEAEVSLTTAIAGLFTGLVAQWLDAGTATVIAEGTPDAGGDIVVGTTFGGANALSQVLNITWKTNDPGAPIFDGNVTVSTVPVPAGLLLLGTALAGLGLTRRKA